MTAGRAAGSGEKRRRSVSRSGRRERKNRLNFLDLLRAGYTDYVINAAALRAIG